MKENDKKYYRVSQIEGKISFQVEELWNGGEVKSPFGSKEAAMLSEEKYAKENGFIDDLVLEKVVEEKISYADAFDKDSDGNWRCIKGCSIEIDKKVIVFPEGLHFTRGTLFLGVNVPKWLDENI